MIRYSIYMKDKN